MIQSYSRAAIQIVKSTEAAQGGKPRLRTYSTPQGINCIGWGHVLTPHEKVSMPMSYDMADAHLRRDLDGACNQLRQLLEVRLDQHHFDALACWVMHAQHGVCQHSNDEYWKESTLISLVNQERFILASSEFDNWIMRHGRIYPFLHARRMLEKKLFTTAEL